MDISALNTNAAALVANFPCFAIIGEKERYVAEIRQNPTFVGFTDAEIAAAVREAVQADIIRRNLAARNASTKPVVAKIVEKKLERPKLSSVPAPDYETVIKPAKWRFACEAVKKGEDPAGQKVTIEGREYEITPQMAFAAKKTVEAEKKPSLNRPVTKPVIVSAARPARTANNDNGPSQTQIRKANRLRKAERKAA